MFRHVSRFPWGVFQKAGSTNCEFNPKLRVELLWVSGSRMRSFYSEYVYPEFGMCTTHHNNPSSLESQYLDSPWQPLTKSMPVFSHMVTTVSDLFFFPIPIFKKKFFSVFFFLGFYCLNTFTTKKEHRTKLEQKKDINTTSFILLLSHWQCISTHIFNVPLTFDYAISTILF